MIDRKQLDSHPVNKLAEKFLRERKSGRNQQVVALLDFILEYLDSLPAEAFHQGYLEDLKDLAHRQTEREEQSVVAAFFVGDFQDFQEQMEQALDEKGELWPVLEEHLHRLYRDLKGKSLEDAASILLENLFSSLQEVYPSFGPR